jgi:lysophospholipase L1-like esterase
MLNHFAPKVSILGDSISTLKGYSPEAGYYYDPEYSRNTGISSAKSTWWMKVILGLGGTLLVNNSYAGSTICRDGYQPASSPWRIAKLKKGDVLPDYVLIYSGLNDVAFYRSPEEFQEHYSNMLLEISGAYPEAEIWCGTLCRSFQANPDWATFINLDACQPLSLYNQSIRDAVYHSDCHLADLSSFDVAYSSLDSVHPDASGMEILAQLWLRCMLE